MGYSLHKPFPATPQLVGGGGGGGGGANAGQLWTHCWKWRWWWFCRFSIDGTPVGTVTANGGQGGRGGRGEVGGTPDSDRNGSAWNWWNRRHYSATPGITFATTTTGTTSNGRPRRWSF